MTSPRRGTKLAGEQTLVESLFPHTREPNVASGPARRSRSWRGWLGAMQQQGKGKYLRDGGRTSKPGGRKNCKLVL
jgi:hypothetical protein